MIAFIFGILELVALNLDLPKNIAMWGLGIFILLLMMVLTNRFFRLQKQVERYATGLEKFSINELKR